MNTLFVDTQTGKKNIVFGVAVFLLFAVGIGIPLTLDFFGVQVWSDEQYQLWKVVHGYGIFIAVINCLVGTNLDELKLSHQQKEVLSWSFIIAGLFGAVGRMALVLLALFEGGHLAASLGEVVFFTIGAALFLYGWTQRQRLLSQDVEAMKRGRQPAR